MNIDIVYNSSIALTGIAGIIGWSYLPTNIKAVVILTWVAFFVETMSKYFVIDGFQTQLYYFYTIVEFGILGFVFVGVVQKKYAKELFRTIWLLGIFLLLIVPLIWDYKIIAAYNFKIESYWAIALTSVFFLEIAASDKYVVLKSYPLFWIAVGVFMFYVGNLLLFSSIEYLYKLDKNLAKNVFLWINRGLNIFMYFMFLVAFICQHPRVAKRFL